MVKRNGMNAAYREVLRASRDERRALFLQTARRLGTAVQQIEKDFWVCWTLDVLFNGLSTKAPRLLFKGGTSLSKAYGLIDRFSEDIDITVFRGDLGESVSIDELEALSGKKRQARLDAIRVSCQAYINGSLFDEFGGIVQSAMDDAAIPVGQARVSPDDSDVDGQTLLFWYPSVTEIDGYIRSAVKIESGAKSALDPHRLQTVEPYVAREVSHLDLRVQGVVTVDPERTFWDKVVILHGTRRWFEHRGILRHEGQRISRHYYDLFRLVGSDVGERAIGESALGADCARHARMFFNRPDFDLSRAIPGTLALVPPDGMKQALQRDYDAMVGMIFGPVPTFDDVLASIVVLEGRLNA